MSPFLSSLGSKLDSLFSEYSSIFDDGVYLTIDYDSPAQDPLNFKDTKKYTDDVNTFSYLR